MEGNDCIWIIDPGDTDWILQICKSDSLCIQGIFLTHGHFDHIYGVNDILQRYPDCKVYTNAHGKKMLESEKLNMSRYHETPYVIKDTEAIVTVFEDEDIMLNDNVSAKAIFTPGHNPSCITWMIGDFLFTGDAYIPGVKVITNLPGGNKIEAEESTKLIKSFIPKLIIYPGHSLNYNKIDQNKNNNYKKL